MTDTTDETDRPAAGSNRGGRYSFDIDLDSDSTHATVVKLIGADKRVLELGPATGYMSEVLRERGCAVVGIEIDPSMASVASEHCDRVIVADIDTVDLQKELGEERYDVIVAADVLEHLKDPLGALRRLSPFLARDTGYFVISLPNVAHGSVRLALLEGRFPYQEIGLLDSTHLRFFTRESIERLVDDADLLAVEFYRQNLNIDASEVSFDESSVPNDVLQTLIEDPDARTYQFVFKALPLAHPGLRHLQQLFWQQSRELERIGVELAAAKRESATAKAAFEQQANAAARDAELRAALVEAHDQMLRRDIELKRLNEELIGAHQSLDEARRERDASRSDLQDKIREQESELRLLRVRLDRITGSAPVRAWHRVGRLPFLRHVIARRTAGYNAALDRDGVGR